jgi:hypothetical protein
MADIVAEEIMWEVVAKMMEEVYHILMDEVVEEIVAEIVEHREAVEKTETRMYEMVTEEQTVEAKEKDKEE